MTVSIRVGGNQWTADGDAAIAHPEDRPEDGLPSPDDRHPDVLESGRFGLLLCLYQSGVDVFFVLQKERL